MARVKIEGIKDLSSRLKRNIRIEVSKLFRDEDLRIQIGDIVVEDIKENADFGRPAESTERWREIYDRLNSTDSSYDRNKLNAVFTGELLEDLRTNVLAVPTEFSYEIGHSNNLHKKYRGKGGLIGTRTPYSEISDYLINGLEYNYMVLSTEAKTRITELIQEKIFELLSK